MQIIKKNGAVVFRASHIDPQSGEEYCIDHSYTLKEYKEIKKLIENDRCSILL